MARRPSWSVFWPQTVRARLAALFVALSTVLLGLFGGGSYFLTQQRLTEQQDAFKEQLRQHLSQPVAKALWVYDLAGLNAALESELGGAVHGLAVHDPSGKLITYRGVLPQAVGAQPLSDGQILVFEVPPMGERAMGQIVVGWSDARFKRALSQTRWLAVGQLLGVTLGLGCMLWVGIDRLIFRRVGRLQQALDDAAGRAHAADIVPLPVTVQDEFGAITRSINAITGRLGLELEAGRESEEEARVALSNLQSALDGLVRAEKMASLGSLVAGIAHELNTPIGNIVMVASTQQELAQAIRAKVNARALSSRALLDYTAQALDGAELALRAAERAAELIQNFKLVAVDQVSERLRDFDLAQQITEVLSVLAHVLARTPVRLTTHLEPGIAMRSYPGPLGQVITNLVVNAIKHGFEENQPGEIVVAAARQHDFARITVSDNGAGIPTENLGKIFDPFFTTKLGQGGSGLGLYVSHNIAYGPLEGSLAVRSVVGQGATFTLLIPCQLRSRAQTPAESTEAMLNHGQRVR